MDRKRCTDRERFPFPWSHSMRVYALILLAIGITIVFDGLGGCTSRREADLELLLESKNVDGARVEIVCFVSAEHLRNVGASQEHFQRQVADFLARDAISTVTARALRDTFGVQRDDRLRELRPARSAPSSFSHSAAGLLPESGIQIEVRRIKDGHTQVIGRGVLTKSGLLEERCENGKN